MTYTFGTDERMSAPHELALLPPVGASKSVTFALFGDLGFYSASAVWTAWNEFGSPESTHAALAREAAAGTIDAIVHIGDISYACGISGTWDLFLDAISRCVRSLCSNMRIR